MVIVWIKNVYQMSGYATIQVKHLKLTPAILMHFVTQCHVYIIYISDIQPHIEINEQPQARGFRFRYHCEGESHGSLRGEHSCSNMKTYPSIRVYNLSLLYIL